MTTKEDEQLTEWERPGIMMETHYGTISYRNWCNKEKDRIKQETGRELYIKEGGGKDEDRISLWEKYE